MLRAPADGSSGGGRRPQKVKWVVDTFEPVRRLFFNHTEFQIVGPPSPQGNANGSQWALLAGSVKNTSKGSWEAMRAAKTDAGVHDTMDQSDCGSTLKEIVVFREPQVVHGK